MKLAHGSYLADGAATTIPLGWGDFKPDFFFVKEKETAGSEYAIMWAAGMLGTQGKLMAISNAVFTNQFTAVNGGTGVAGSFGVAAFSTPAGLYVNRTGKNYLWFAARDDGDGKFAVASLTQDGTVEAQNLTTGAFTGTPDVAIVFTEDSSSTPVFVTKDFPAGDSTLLSNSAKTTGMITALISGGVSLGTSANVQRANKKSYGVFFKELAGVLKCLTYTGNATSTGDSAHDNRGITGAGFQPEISMVKSAGAHLAYFRTPAMTGDQSTGFTNVNVATNRIQAHQADGFQVGTENNVNLDATVYYAVVIRTPDITAPSISNVSVDTPTSSGATINFDTSDAVDGTSAKVKVKYATAAQWAGSPGIYPSATTLTALLASPHAVPLTGLAASTTYHYAPYAEDTTGNNATGSDGTFTTAASDAVAPDLTSGPTATPDETTASVTFVTDEASSLLFDYLTSAQYATNGSAFTAGVTTLTYVDFVNNRTVSLTNLTQNTGYTYRLRLADREGNTRTKSPYTFSTLAAPTTNTVLQALTLSRDFATITGECIFKGDTNNTNTSPKAKVTVAAAGAASGATSLPVTSVPFPLVAGTLLRFSNGVLARLTVDAATSAGAATLTVAALPAALNSGRWAYANGVQFRKVGEATWRFGLPAARVDDGVYQAYLFKIFRLDPDTDYEVRLTVTDADGVTNSPRTAIIRTRAENIVTPTALLTTVNKYLDAAAAGGGNGTIGTPWKTLIEANAGAVNGDVIRVAPGIYTKLVADVTKRLTFVAQYPAINDSRAIINAGNQAIICHGVITAPTAATEAGVIKNKWVQVVVTDSGGTQRTLWKLPYADHAVSAVSQAGWHATIQAVSGRIAHWKQGSVSGGLFTVAQWADKLFRNLTYNYGLWQETLGSKDVYLRLPPNAPNADPNQFYITLGSSSSTDHGLRPNGADQRYCGLVFKKLWAGLHPQVGSDRLIVDHCLFDGNYYGMRVSNQGVVYARDHVYQYNRFIDSNLWDPTGSPERSTTIPWVFIKEVIEQTPTVNYPGTRIGAASETFPLGLNGGALNMVIRRNTFDGVFNGVTALGTTDRYHSFSLSGYENHFQYMGDDCWEPEGVVQMCWSLFQNTAAHVVSFLSMAELNYGPIYTWGNYAFDVSAGGLPKYSDGSGNPGGSVYKCTSPSGPRPLVFIINNTFWTDGLGRTHEDAQGVPIGTYFGVKGAAGGLHAFYVRNTILRTTARVFETPAPAFWDEDFDHFVDAPTPLTDSSGIQVYTGSSNVSFTTDVPGYRAASGQGANSNLYGDFITGNVVDNNLNNPAGGDLSLKAGSLFIGAGTWVPNIVDLDGDWLGAAPDLGYLEFGTPVENPVPTATLLNPANRDEGLGAFTLIVNGSGFVPTSVVKWAGANRTTTFISSTQLQAAILSGDVAADGTAAVTVFSPTPSGGTSNALTFTIDNVVASNPVPTLTGIAPATAQAGATATTVVVTGTNFVSGSVVRWDGADRATTFVSATQLQAAIPATDLATAGDHDVTVFNPTPGGGTSGAAIFAVTAVPVSDTTPPVITSGPTITVGATSASIAVGTDEAASLLVDFGTTVAYGFQALDDELLTARSIDLGGLAGNTTYHYQLTLTDDDGNALVTGDGTFVTLVSDLRALARGHGVSLGQRSRVGVR